jgi:hypothetical protein
MYLQYISNIQQFKYSSFHQPHIGNTKFTESSVSAQHNNKQSSTAQGVTFAYFLKITENRHQLTFKEFAGKTF